MIEKLLKLVGPAHVIAGLAVFVLGFFPQALTQILGHMPASQKIVWSPFLIAVFGPTIASWGLLFGVLVQQFFATPSERLWRFLLLAIILWAPLDSALCLYYGLWSGVVLNAVVALAIIGLLFLVRGRIRE